MWSPMPNFFTSGYPQQQMCDWQMNAERFERAEQVYCREPDYQQMDDRGQRFEEQSQYVNYQNFAAPMNENEMRQQPNYGHNYNGNAANYQHNHYVQGPAPISNLEFVLIMERLPDLKGSEGAEKIKVFFKKFSSATEGWPEAKRISALESKVSGRAERAFNAAIANQPYRYDSIRRSMEIHLEETDCRGMAAFNELANGVRRKTGEHLDELADRVYRTVRRAYTGMTEDLIEEYAIKHLIRALENPKLSLTLEMTRRPGMCYDEFVALAARAESIQNATKTAAEHQNRYGDEANRVHYGVGFQNRYAVNHLKRPQTQQRPNFVENVRSQGDICGNGKEPGHTFRERTQRSPNLDRCQRGEELSPEAFCRGVHLLQRGLPTFQKPKNVVPNVDWARQQNFEGVRRNDVKTKERMTRNSATVRVLPAAKLDEPAAILRGKSYQSEDVEEKFEKAEIDQVKLEKKFEEKSSKEEIDQPSEDVPTKQIEEVETKSVSEDKKFWKNEELKREKVGSGESREMPNDLEEATDDGEVPISQLWTIVKSGAEEVRQSEKGREGSITDDDWRKNMGNFGRRNHFPRKAPRNWTTKRNRERPLKENRDGKCRKPGVASATGKTFGEGKKGQPPEGRLGAARTNGKDDHHPEMCRREFAHCLSSECRHLWPNRRKNSTAPSFLVSRMRSR